MANLEQDAMAQAEALLLDSGLNILNCPCASDETISASPRLAQAEVFEQAAARFKSTAISLRRDHNSLQPVNQLPPEILVDIFQSCLEVGDGDEEDHEYADEDADEDEDKDEGEDGVRRDATKLHRLCAVCGRWKHLVEGSPILWSYVSGLDPLQHIEKALRLSEPMPITVVFLRAADNQLSETEFTALVNPHVTRWSRATIDHTDLDQNPQAWESSELPNLHTLDIASDSDHSERVPILLSDGRELPNLQVVNLVDIPLRWDPGQLPALRVLELALYRSPRTAPTTSQLLQLLMTTPRLERLSLADVAMSEDSAFQLSVNLPYLINIKLKTIPLNAIQHLLSSIKLPQYDGNRMDRNGSQHLPSEEYSNSPNDPAHHESHFDVLGVEYSQINLSKGMFALSASATWGRSPFLECIEVVLRRFAEHLTTSQGIRVEIGKPDLYANSVIPVVLDKLGRFPSVKVVRLIECYGIPRGPLPLLIQLLTRPKILADSVVWYLPHLEIILINMQDPPFSELGELCRERRGAALRSGSPKAIMELHISPRNSWRGTQYSRFDYTPEAELDKLQGALGGGQLFWGSELWKGSLDRQLPESTSSSLG